MQFKNLNITALAANGHGVAIAGRRKVFVRGAMVGDIVDAQSIELKSKLAVAIITKIHFAGAQRIEAKCKHFTQCGGCSLQYMPIEQQLEFKNQRINQQLQRYTGLTSLPAVQSISNTAWAYRNRARFLIEWQQDQPFLAMRAQQSNSPVRIQHCEVLRPLIMARFDQIRDWVYAVGPRAGVELRVACDDQNIALAIDVKPHRAKQLPPWQGPLHNFTGEALNEAAQLTMEVQSHQLSFNAADFTQSNHALNDLAIEEIKTWLPPCATAIDLFSGIGNLSLGFASICGQITGYESVQSMVQKAKQNAQKNALKHLQFIESNLYETAPSLDADLVIADPPRRGLGAAVIGAIGRDRPQYVLYISCDLQSLQSEVKSLLNFGYRISKLASIDFFSHTPEIETVVLLQQSV